MTLEQAIEKWPGLQEIADNRKRALKLMFTCGWRLESIVQRGQKHYKFSRPDTGGLHDVLELTHSALDPIKVAKEMTAYEPDLRRLVNDALFTWILQKEATQ